MNLQGRTSKINGGPCQMLNIAWNTIMQLNNVLTLEEEKESSKLRPLYDE